MVGAILPFGGLAVVVKTIDELTDKELQLQAEYANCVSTYAEVKKCRFETPNLAKAVVGISLLITVMGLFYLVGDK